MKKITFLSVGMSLLVAGCSSNEEPAGGSGEGKVITLTTEEAVIAEDAQQFQYDFFTAACDVAGVDGNVVVSPVSEHVLMSMIANAADGSGRDEILSAMGCDGLSGLNAYNLRILDYLPQADRSVTLALANSVWYSKEYEINTSFSDILGNNYLAPSYKRDFDDASLVGEINRWCSDNTGKMIPEIVSDIDPSVEMILSNAMFFKGDWTSPFDEGNTKRETFHGAVKESTVDMMHIRNASMRFIVTDKFKGGVKSFGRNGAYHAWFILPQDGVGIDEALADFCSRDKSLQSDVFDATVDFALPRFAYATSTMNLQKPLEKMGIASVFSSGGVASFDAPFKGIWKVEQKVSIEFNEKGAKAAAATTGSLSSTLNPTPSKEQTLVLDRPFIFMVQENTTGSLLVAGRIMDIAE